MLMPKRVKYRKTQRGKMRGDAHAGAAVTFGEFGLQALGRGWVTSQQIEAAREAMTLAGHKLPIRSRFVMREEQVERSEAGRA